MILKLPGKVNTICAKSDNLPHSAYRAEYKLKKAVLKTTASEK
jgi:hypothetical protein